MSEKRYYDTVRKWLESQGYYCGGNITIKGKENFYQDIGTKQRRIDVAGVKNVGNKFEDDVEIVAIEVRNKQTISYGDIFDAAKYHNCVHKCYLASTAQTTPEIRQYAERANVGLLKLVEGKPPQVLHHPSPKEPESYSEMIRFLERFQIVKCSLCGCFFERFVRSAEKYHSYYEVSRAAYFKVTKKTGKNPLKSSDIESLSSEYKIRRYICYPCLDEFFLNPKRIARIQKNQAEMDESDAYWNKEDEAFACLVGDGKNCTEFVYDPIEIVEHLRDAHKIPPDKQTIKGWTEDHEKLWLEHVSKNKKE